MKKIQELEEQIEQVRFLMYQTYNINPLDPNVLKISHELDQLLNQLNSISNEKNK
ncbi:Spo0E family sporulation regulatory protein-aspartic acid phosphatase [Halobacillus sp. A5]|uniref:Spo0E family sporulation regulatory protein-aspartic acid phosphatase n=1 Tax=Halobacillus sp. A5 TaxID=2880263 RepID=UPI0020A63B31|nr:aspartyl-phosphate phosphatase Spo0E family protein [Halobacillus sp. A5]